ncbi:putative nuclease domain-containing protein [Phaeomoniella chlamydospora]|uniref:Probable endonuclease LCL3 n=1 Tax=Phaeomoniella chlamydospora TaxID=158046 RepID=A0A0G2GBC4_PHACM|nr:putative nuclease domain-containing protein [Phaeomoniella chlamydospora]
MRWPNFWGYSPRGDGENDSENPPSISKRIATRLPDVDPNKSSKLPIADELLTTIITPSTYTNPSVLVPTVLLTTVLLSTISLSRRYLTHFPSASHIPPSFFRTRSLFGRVTSVGDADNFRLYHTPGGRLAGWGWLRHIPSITDPKTSTKRIKVKSDETIHIRLAGVDAPELAHFGQPAQPYGEEALAFLRKMLDGKRVRVWLWRPDQYGRVVGTVYVRQWLGIWRTDVGRAMLKAGMATVYEAKSGAEFGGKRKEAEYRKIEERARENRKGLWSSSGDKSWESPRMFKDRTKSTTGQTSEGGDGLVSKAFKTTRSWLLFWK